MPNLFNKTTTKTLNIVSSKQYSSYGSPMCIKILLILFCCHSLAISQTKDTLLFKNGNARVYQNKVIVDTVEVYNSKTDYDEFMKREGMPGAECTTNYSSYYNPLSLVGHIYSYEWGSFETAACGPTGNFLDVQTISLETGKKVSILELVDEKDLVAAFKNDSWVRRMSSEASLLLEGETLQEILDFFSTGLMGPRFSASGFCVLSFAEWSS